MPMRIIMDIPENHRRSIEVTFWMLDQMLSEMEQWALRHEIHSTLYQEINTLSDEQCELILEEIKILRDMLKEVRDDLELRSHEQPISMSLEVMCTLFINDYLMPLLGRNLDHIGKTPLELKSYLEVKVKEFTPHLRRIADIGYQSGVEEKKGKKE